MDFNFCMCCISPPLSGAFCPQGLQAPFSRGAFRCWVFTLPPTDPHVTATQTSHSRWRWGGWGDQGSPAHICTCSLPQCCIYKLSYSAFLAVNVAHRPGLECKKPNAFNVQHIKTFSNSYQCMNLISYIYILHIFIYYIVSYLCMYLSCIFIYKIF